MHEQSTSAKRHNALPWLFAASCFLVGLLDTWLFVSLGLEFTFKGRDATVIIGVFLTLSFGLFGYFWGLALRATRREKQAATARRQALLKLAEVQGRVAHMEKMAALGQVVASIAHEVRNPLAIIRSQVQNLSETVADDHQPEPEDLEIILGEIDRLGRVVEEISHFSRPIQPRNQTITTGEILDRVSFMVQALYQERGQPALDTKPATSWTFQSDPDLICQALMTLIINAVEVSPVDKQVSLSVAHQEGVIQFHIADEGPGIPEALRPQVVEPFYTTKTDGTGLGMAIAQDIVKALGGKMKIGDSRAGGAQLSLHLPSNPITATI